MPVRQGRRVRDVRARVGHRARESRTIAEVLAMRSLMFLTLSQVVELGIFAAAAGALAVGLMHVR